MSADKPDRNIRRNARAGVVEQRPVGGRSAVKKDKPFKLEARWWIGKHKWYTVGNYATEAIAMEVAHRHARKHLSWKAQADRPATITMKINGASIEVSTQ